VQALAVGSRRCDASTRKGAHVPDAGYTALVLLFFLLSWLYVRALERLQG